MVTVSKSAIQPNMVSYSQTSEDNHFALLIAQLINLQFWSGLQLNKVALVQLVVALELQFYYLQFWAVFEVLVLQFLLLQTCSALADLVHFRSSCFAVSATANLVQFEVSVFETADLQFLLLLTWCSFEDLKFQSLKVSFGKKNVAPAELKFPVLKLSLTLQFKQWGEFQFEGQCWTNSAQCRKCNVNSLGSPV
ncbi:hypothetical protein Patl1_24403 [Pistacia atlantica]|uniref:Uncharacterized protein n=1 Tax=Pistacia atlantica TaxID=434234 RepID=A0ACC1A0E4_9ROSI|nr:hypothetical protein Patl1_24403 [Pistacia atlantica]